MKRIVGIVYSIRNCIWMGADSTGYRKPFSMFTSSNENFFSFDDTEKD